MSLPGGTGFSGRQFWGIQLNHQSFGANNVRVNSDKILHISKVLVDVGHCSHKDNCSVSIGVRYEPDRCDCDVTKQSCSLHPQQKQSCVICIIKPGQKCEADLDLDLHYVGGKNLTFYFSRHCDTTCHSQLVSVNISGYEVRG